MLNPSGLEKLNQDTWEAQGAAPAVVLPKSLRDIHHLLVVKVPKSGVIFVRRKAGGGKVAETAPNVAEFRGSGSPWWIQEEVGEIPVPR